MVSSNRRRVTGRAVIGFGLVGLLASCAGGSPGPAPVFFGNQDNANPGWSGSPPSGVAEMPPPRPMPPMAPTAARHVLVAPGETLSGIAHRYHVPQAAIIAANHLRPPYQIDIGTHLVIPGAGEGPVREAELGTPLPPPRAMTPLSSAAPPPAEIPLQAGPPPTRSADVIPLDGPTPRAVPNTLSPPAATAPPPRGEMSVAEEAREDSGTPASGSAVAPPAPAAIHDGRFPWPVRGRVVSGYNTSASNRNDGINIAAPLGAPVRAIDGGEVAYAGNEVPGYGNLILVKHPDGWISAYAHLEDLLVTKGETVRAGQVIAKVGTTGGVSRPQLHFELRHGKNPVDPLDFLTPAPSAANGAGSRAG